MLLWLWVTPISVTHFCEEHAEISREQRMTHQCLPSFTTQQLPGHATNTTQRYVLYRFLYNLVIKIKKYNNKLKKKSL